MKTPSVSLDVPLFIKKLSLLIAGTLLLIPLLYLKHHGFAIAYLTGLLVLHVGILYVWLMRTPWRRLVRQKKAFGVRVVAVVFFAYLLAQLHFDGSVVLMVRNTLLALLAHIGILLGLMVNAGTPSKPAGRSLRRATRPDRGLRRVPKASQARRS